MRVNAARAGQDLTHNRVKVDSEESTGTRICLPISYNASQLLSWQYLPAPSPDLIDEYLSFLGKLTVSASGVLDVTTGKVSEGLC